MKTIHCAHPPHHHDGFVATCQLWTASDGVHALLVLESKEGSTIYLSCSYIMLCMYYALRFVLVEHSVCHEPIFVLMHSRSLRRACLARCWF